MSDFNTFIYEAASVKPSPRQAAWFDLGFYAFIHFTVNTYTDREWGLGNEDEKIFNPVDLDCDEWVTAIKSAGMGGLILTAKHHDGFCLWPSKYTEHSVKNSPWKDGRGDVVREAAEACRRGGIKFGVYLSPWDRNSKYYGTPEYNDYYCNQLIELLTNYGELFMIWFDGACGEGPNGKKQVYDYDRYISLIRKYQPNACIFNDHGPDVRWCGNESGDARRSEWAVVPSELCFRSEVQTGEGPFAGSLEGIYNSDPDIGELPQALCSRGLVFTGSEIDMSIRPGWFYHENEEPHSLDRLFNTYLRSVGANASFNLNVPPMRSGRFDPRDIARLRELGEAIKNAFGPDKLIHADMSRIELGEAQCEYKLKLDKAEKLAYIELREDLSTGQRVESFVIRNHDGGACYRGFTIGNRKICRINAETDEIRVRVTAARSKPEFREIKLYKA